MGLNFGMLHQFAGAEKSIKVIAAVLYGRRIANSTLQKPEGEMGKRFRRN